MGMTVAWLKEEKVAKGPRGGSSYEVRSEFGGGLVPCATLQPLCGTLCVVGLHTTKEAVHQYSTVVGSPAIR